MSLSRGGRSVARGGDFLKRAGQAKEEAFEEEQSHGIEHVPWDEFFTWFKKNWKQGEHVAMIGTSGQGKSTLAKTIIPIRNYVVVFVTKARDPLFALLKKDGFKKVSEFQGVPDIAPKQLLAPSLSKGKSSMVDQRKVFEDAMYQVFAAGNWCIWLDELRYITDNLKLQQDVEFLLLQGRALGISLVSLTQRPVKVPLEVFDQSTHLFFWRDTDEANRRRIGGIGGVSGAILWEEVASLEQYEFIYLNTRTGYMVKSKVEL